MRRGQHHLCLNHCGVASLIDIRGKHANGVGHAVFDVVQLAECESRLQGGELRQRAIVQRLLQALDGGAVVRHGSQREALHLANERPFAVMVGATKAGFEHGIGARGIPFGEQCLGTLQLPVAGLTEGVGGCRPNQRQRQHQQHPTAHRDSKVKTMS